MKNLTLILVALCTLVFTNCKTKSKATGSSSASGTSEKSSADGGTKVNCRLAVSFNSIGSGINAAKYDEIKNYIDKHPKKPGYEQIPMGREGEVDICLSLKEMNNSEQKDFIKEIKKLSEGADRVQVSENVERTKR